MAVLLLGIARVARCVRGCLIWLAGCARHQHQAPTVPGRKDRGKSCDGHHAMANHVMAIDAHLLGVDQGDPPGVGCRAREACSSE